MILRPNWVLLLALTVRLTRSTLGDDSPVQFSTTPTAVTLGKDGTAVVRINISLTDSYHIYSTVAQSSPQGAAPEPTSISITPSGIVALDGALRPSPADTHFDANFQMDLATLTDKAWIDVPLKAGPRISAGSNKITLVVSYQACNDDTCLPKGEFDLPLEVISEAASASVPAIGRPDAAELAASAPVRTLVLPFTDHQLPTDWRTRLVPPIEKLAADFPNGRAAFVYFSRLINAVEAQDPTALPALIEEMAKSPNLAVRALAGRRLQVAAAMKEPLNLKFVALDGTPVDTSRWRGKVVIVDFWATWCVPCVQSIPHLRDLYATYHSRGLEIVSVSMDKANAKEALQKLVAKLQMPWPQYFDGLAFQTPYAVRYGVQPIPHVLLADPNGIIVAVNPAPEILEARIKQMLKL